RLWHAFHRKRPDGILQVPPARRTCGSLSRLQGHFREADRRRRWPERDARQNGTVRERCVPLGGFSGEPPGYSEGRCGVLWPEFGGDAGNSDTRPGAAFQCGRRNLPSATAEVRSRLVAAITLTSTETV